MLPRISVNLLAASLFCSFVCVSTFLSHAFAIDTTNEHLTFTGSTAPGTVSATLLGGKYSFTYTGDETLSYEIDVNDAAVKGGEIRIKEIVSDSFPIDGAGLIYKSPDGNANWFPKDLKSKTTLVSHALGGKVLTLNYLLNFNGLHPYIVQITPEAKTLRIRFFDPTSNVSFGNNFNGVFFGKTTGVENPVVVYMQGLLAAPPVLFRKATASGTQHFFVANFIDMFQSNAANYGIPDIMNPSKGSDWITLGYNTVIQYKQLSDGKIPAPLDDTLLVVVSSKIKDVLLTSTAPRSPYLSSVATRLFFNAPATPQWHYYTGMFDLYDSLGMYNLIGYFWDKWSAGALDAPNYHLGPDWAPAKDEVNFKNMLKKGFDAGHFLSAYMAFNCLPPTAPAPVNNPQEIARDKDGTAKFWKSDGLNCPSLTIDASGNHALSEAQKLKTLGGSGVYVDIQTYGSTSKGSDGDHLDQIATSPWSKTHRQSYNSQKNWFDDMRRILGGALLGEGSIGTPNTNMEFLWYGYVDSVQRVVNTGASMSAYQLPLNSPSAPTNWPIIPEYEWRVAAVNQVNHGNGFYDRFFSKGDGSTIVNSDGTPIFPLSQDARDLYQTFLLNYGHAGYVITNGTQSTNQGYLTHLGAAETYFMTNALQSFYLLSPVADIRYYHQGVFKKFEHVISQTETVDTFRHIPIAVLFQNGGILYVNNGTSTLNVTDGGKTYTLPAKTGWYASIPNFVQCFSAIAPGTAGNRIDYCNAAGQYEYFNGRGKVTGYGNIVTANKKAKWTVMPAAKTVFEDDTGNLQVTNGTPPTVSQIYLLPFGNNKILAKGSRIGLKAMALYSNSSFRDLTSLVGWNSTKPTIATINRAGVIEALNSGQTVITATAPGGVGLPASVTITVP
jgi:hypothetical protein